MTRLLLCLVLAGCAPAGLPAPTLEQPTPRLVELLPPHLSPVSELLPPPLAPGLGELLPPAR